MAITDKLNTLARVIMSKTGRASKMTIEDMIEEVYGIVTEKDLFKFMGRNAQLVDTYDETWTLADTSFVIGETSSTSATTILASISNRYTGKTVAIGDKDVVVVQKCHVRPTHVGASGKAECGDYAAVSVFYMSKRKTNATSANTTRQGMNSTYYILNYKNTSGNSTRALAYYGFYMQPQTPSVSSTTSANAYMRCSSPPLTCRASTTYETPDNMKKVTACEYQWHIDVYLVDSGSSLIRNYQNDIEDIFDNGI